ncbi:hypothetical protein FSP39_017411 [Pinctada imbricata]|uniref:Pro-Pol polyprotein n=1 Tax=Pinctada imbricata TaxID=66713 RepID=A0AA88XER8_PINIB|nr:hypothetical protein FSP39_017411 [Pinctada imbricata]
MLVDTGSSVTIISRKIFEKHFCKLPIQTSNVRLVTATGEETCFNGKLEVTLRFANQKVKHTVWIADIEYEGILGCDFLHAYDCNVMCGEGAIYMRDYRVQMYSDKDLNVPVCCRVVMKDTVTVQAQSEITVQGRLIDTYDSTRDGVIENTVYFVDRMDLLIAKALVRPKKGFVPLHIVNFSMKPVTLSMNSVVAVYNEIETGGEYVNVLKGEDNSSPSKKSEKGIPSHLENLFDRSSENLDNEQVQILKNLLSKNENVFSRSENDIGRTRLVEHSIDTGGARPIKQHPYRVPLAKRLAAEKEIQQMAERGVIEPSSSPWCSPVVMVTKKDGTIRFCLDFRKLNSCTLKDSQPLPRIDDTLDALSGSVWFSTLDLKSGYWQVGMSPSDREKTAFSIFGSGLWQFTVMPFGLCNAPATFERLMERVLAGLSWVKCLIFLDDIIVMSKSFSTHIENLQEVFDRLNRANLKLSPEKCCLLQTEVKYLGHIVSKEGIKTDPNKIQSVVNWPKPRKVKDVRSFVGLCSYYRKFVKNFAQIAKPLHRLTEKGREFVWDEECENAFQKLKQTLTTAPILAYPKEDGKFVIDTDASNEGMGAVLSQVQNGEERVLCYFSKCLSGVERRYCVTRRELLAVVCAVRQFHHYVYGRKFLIRTDHGSLRWLMNFKKPEGQIARWLETLASYDFDIEHRAGRVHQNADALSRRPFYDSCTYCERYENSHMELPHVERIWKGSAPPDAVENQSECKWRPSVRDDERKNEGDKNAPSMCGVIHSFDELNREVHVPDESANDLIVKNDYSVVENDYCTDVSTNSRSQGHLVRCTKADSPLGVDVKENWAAIGPHSQSGPLHQSGWPTGHGCENVTPNEIVCTYTYASMLEATGSDDSTQLGVVDVVACKSNKDGQGQTENGDQSQEVVQNTTTFAEISIESMEKHQRDDRHLNKLFEWFENGSKPKWVEISEYGPELKYLWQNFEMMCFDNGVIWYRWYKDTGEHKCLLVLPPQLRSIVLKEMHDAPTSGHLGYEKTLARVKERFIWYGMSKDVKRWCETCEICGSKRGKNRKAKAPLQKYIVGAPLERVAVDILGPFPRSEKGNRYVMVVGDYFTKWLEAYPIPDQEAATVAQILFEKFISVFGVPLQLHTDQGKNFDGILFGKLCSLLGIEKTRTTPMRPQSDGMIERGNRTITSMLSAYVSIGQKDWDVWLPVLMMAYRSAVHSSTGVTPYKMMFGRETTLPIDLALGRPSKSPEQGEKVKDLEYVGNLEEKLSEIHEFARKRLKVTSEAMRRKYDCKLSYVSYNEGDLVWVHTPTRTKGLSPKLQRPWTGPHSILRKINNVLFLVNCGSRKKSKVIHHDRMRLYVRRDQVPRFSKL